MVYLTNGVVMLEWLEQLISQGPILAGLYVAAWMGAGALIVGLVCIPMIILYALLSTLLAIVSPARSASDIDEDRPRRVIRVLLFVGMASTVVCASYAAWLLFAVYGSHIHPDVILWGAISGASAVVTMVVIVFEIVYRRKSQRRATAESGVLWLDARMHPLDSVSSATHEQHTAALEIV